MTNTPKTKAEKLAAIDLDKLAQLKQLIENKIVQTEPLKNYKEQIYLDITNEGLRVQIFDNDRRVMFPRSSARMNDYAIALLANLAAVINQVDNRVSITGHTDVMQFQKSDEYTNWELSTDRANAARKALIAGGLAENRIARIVGGLASTILFDAAEPSSATNRRISIIILSNAVDAKMQQQEIKFNEEIKKGMAARP